MQPEIQKRFVVGCGKLSVLQREHLPLCQQTVLIETFSNSISVKVIKKYDKSAVMQTSDVFQSL